MKKFLKRFAIFCAGLLVVAVLAILLLPAKTREELIDVTHGITDPVEAAFGERRSLNILLLGVDYNYDRKAQRYTKGARSDTILIVRVEPLGHELSMMSIPRDLMVGIGENSIYGYDRINSAFAKGGQELAQQTVEKVTGLEIDHYVVVKSDVVADLVDMVGGVPIEVEKQMDWDDNWAGLHIHLKPGKQRLSGEDAVGYCRFRRDAEGDFGRIRRQQKFLGALLKELKQKKHWRKFPEFAQIMEEKLTTDLTKGQLVGLASIYKDFPLKNIRKGRPEVEDYFADGSAYLVLAPGEPAAIIKELFTALPDPSVRKISMVIKASPKHVSEARRVAALLRRRGFISVRVKRLKDEPEGKTHLVYHSPDGKGSQVLRDLFPRLVLSKEKKKGPPEATLTVKSAIFVSDEA